MGFWFYCWYGLFPSFDPLNLAVVYEQALNTRSSSANPFFKNMNRPSTWWQAFNDPTKGSCTCLRVSSLKAQDVAKFCLPLVYPANRCGKAGLRKNEGKLPLGVLIQTKPYSTGTKCLNVYG